MLTNLLVGTSLVLLAATKITMNVTASAMNSQMTYWVTFQPPMLNTVCGSK